MNIIFMGTPDFAVPSLNALHDAGLTPVAVVTAPDKQRGRGRILSGTPVKEAALKLGISVLQPLTIKDPDLPDQLRLFAPDIFVVVAFRILPEAVFTIPRLGSFNLHASLLPKYRGAAPINWALINGEHESGVTSFFLKQQVDTGSIILQERVPLHADMTAGELHDLLAVLGADVVVRTVERIAAGNTTLVVQDDSLATPAPKIFRETCRIDWTRSARKVHDFVRGLSPHPAAWTTHAQHQLKIHRTSVSEEASSGIPGTIIRADNTLRVQCGEGSVNLLELQQEGKKALSVEEFLRGYRGEQLDFFEI